MNQSFDVLMFVKSLSHARGFQGRLARTFHRPLLLLPLACLRSATLCAVNVHKCRFQTHVLASQQLLNGLIKSAAILGTLFRFVAAHFHSAQALLWQQDFSLERNECANVLQVGFIKLRPGTLVLALHNYHVTKPGSRNANIQLNSMSIHFRHTKKWRNV